MGAWLGLSRHFMYPITKKKQSTSSCQSSRSAIHANFLPVEWLISSSTEIHAMALCTESLSGHVSKLDIASVSFITLQLVELLEDQLHLTDMHV
mmetsp:Transcript_41531/g.64840  ORF Transcript_41531/g.64840 Transcript_41531/m.64840 type:complete len:94 (-) Transcript_41531:203-484(-)